MMFGGEQGAQPKAPEWMWTILLLGAALSVGVAFIVVVRSVIRQLDVMMRMQLTAIGYNAWLIKAQCCGCFPVFAGGVVLCAVMVTRGLFILGEGLGFYKFFFVHPPHGNPFVIAAKWLVFFGGAVDVASGIHGAIGLVKRDCRAVLILVIWTISRLICGGFATLIVTAYDTMDIGRDWTLVLAFFKLIFDLYLTQVSLEVLLLAVMKGTVRGCFKRVIRRAQELAEQSNAKEVNKNHIVAALLEDDDSWIALEKGGLDRWRTYDEVLAGHDTASKSDPAFHGDLLRLGDDASALVAGAAKLQWQAGHPLLTADHLLQALCRTGTITVDINPKKKKGKHDKHEHTVEFPVDADAMEQFIVEHLEKVERARRELAVGPPGATIFFGVLPLEETVWAYVVLQCALCVTSLCCLLWRGKSIAMLAGLRTVSEMRVVEFLTSVAGFVLSIVAALGIGRHRKARRAIWHEACFSSGRRPALARPESSLGEQYHALHMEAGRRVGTKDPLPSQLASWVKKLKFGTLGMSIYLLFCICQVFVEVPLFGMSLLVGNICGGWMNAIISISAMSHSQFGTQGAHASVSCSFYSVQLLMLAATIVMLKVYMCWCMLALWHLYNYGWTITDFRGADYLEPVSPLPEVLVKLIMGLPRHMQTRLGVGEAKPLRL